MTRFFVNPEDLNGESVFLTGENAAHANVLRMKIGESAIVCDGAGNECICIADSISKDTVVLSVQERMLSSTEPAVRASIYMAFSKGDKFEHVIQKATELGAEEIIGFPSARCVSKPDDKSLKKKLERWQKIAASGAEQSGRGKIPQVLVLGSYKEALARAVEADKALLFYENEKATTLRMALESGKWSSVSLLTGPEGGLEAAEVEAAKSMGFEICTLGSRILRCETAPLCALSAVMYAAGEF